MREIKDIKVSVIMPTYKQKELLHKAVESIISQNHKNIELIVIDDNEEQSYILNNISFLEKIDDPRIKLIKNERNIGSSKSRNVGILNATGEYITFLDDDDIYFNTKIENQLTKMLENDSDYSVTNMILQHENGMKEYRTRNFLENNEELLNLHLKYHITGTSTLMFKKIFLKSIGCFPEKDLGDEFYLMLEAIKKSKNVVHCNEIGVCATVHNETGLSSFQNKIISEEYLYNYKKRYFYKLKQKDIMYIKMRHYAVKAVAYKKGKKKGHMLLNLIRSFTLHPLGFINLLNGEDR